MSPGAAVASRVTDSTNSAHGFCRSGKIDLVEIEPIRHEFTVPVSPGDAFDLFAGGRWWDPAYTADPETFAGLTIGPGVGGAVVEHHRDGRSVTWGRVTVWEPGHRLAYTSTLAQSLDPPSEISVTFEPGEPGDSGGTNGAAVSFEHGGWTETNIQERSKFGDWPVILERFEQLAAEQQG